MIAELISVGTELLMGQVLNTDAQFMAKELAPLGVNVYHQVTVGDNPGRLKDALTQALSRADVAILSGGLGPTGDDLTKETVAELFHKELVMDEAALETLKARFRAFGREMTPNNLKQAMFPVGSIILPMKKAPPPAASWKGKAARPVSCCPARPGSCSPCSKKASCPIWNRGQAISSIPGSFASSARGRAAWSMS